MTLLDERWKPQITGQYSTSPDTTWIFAPPCTTSVSIKMIFWDAWHFCVFKTLLQHVFELQNTLDDQERYFCFPSLNPDIITSTLILFGTICSPLNTSHENSSYCTLKYVPYLMQTFVDVLLINHISGYPKSLCFLCLLGPLTHQRSFCSPSTT